MPETIEAEALPIEQDITPTSGLDSLVASITAEAERLAIEEKEKEAERKAQEKQKEKEAKERAKRINNNPIVKIAKSSIHSVGREYGKKLIRGLLGTFLK